MALSRNTHTILTDRVTRLALVKQVEDTSACSHCTLCLEMDQVAISQLLRESCRDEDHQIQELEPTVKVTVNSIED